MLSWYLWRGRASLKPSPAYFSLSIGTNLQINITLSLAKATKKDTKNAPRLFCCLFATSLQNLITTFAGMKKCSAPQFWRVWCIIILTLVVAMLPHHHHGEAVCMAWSHCDTAEHSVPSHGESIPSHDNHAPLHKHPTPSHDCNENDCVVQSIRTFLPAGTRPQFADAPTWLPFFLPLQCVEVPECTTLTISKETHTSVSRLFYGCRQATAGRAPPFLLT